MWSTYLKIGMRNATRHLRRNLASGLAIAFGFSAMVLLAGYMVRVDNYLSVSTIYLQHSGHIQIFHKDGLRKRLAQPRKFNLRTNEQAEIMAVAQADSRVDFVTRFLTGQGLVGNGCRSYPFSAIGLEPSQEQRIRTHPAVTALVPDVGGVLRGTPLWEQSSSGISVAKGLVDLLGKPKLASESTAQTGALDCSSPNVTSTIARDANVQLVARTFSGGISAIDADITSHYSTGLSISDNVGMQAPLENMQRLFETQTVSFISVFLKDKRDTNLVIKDLREALRARNVEVDLYAWNDANLNPNYTQGRSVLVVTVGFVAIIVAAVVLLSILNALTIAVVEGRAEMGTLRAIGFNPKDIVRIQTAEILYVALLGIIFGAIVTVISVNLIASMHIPFQLPGMSFSIDFQLTPTFGYYLFFAVSILVLCLLATVTTVRGYSSRSITYLLDRGA